MNISDLFHREKQAEREEEKKPSPGERFLERAKRAKNDAERRYWFDRAAKADGFDPHRSKAQRVLTAPSTNRRERRREAAQNRRLKKRIDSVTKRSPLLQALALDMETGRTGAPVSRLLGRPPTKKEKEEEDQAREDSAFALFRKEENRLVKAGVIPKRDER